MYRYHCLNAISKVGLDRFKPEYAPTDRMEDADAILVRSAAMHDMDLPENLLAIARAGAGVNNIPLAKCAEAGIVVFNTPGANANGVKELVLAGMLLASRDILGGAQWVQTQAGNPDVSKAVEKEKKRFAGREISGKKLGIIGLGAIGQLVANAATHLGMDVYGYDPYISVDAAWNLSRSIHHITNVDDIYKNCDYITIHVPAMDSTRGMINAEAIAKMKPDAVLLNLARDILVDEKAVVAALQAGKLGRYVTDFANPTVLGVPGVLVTPHLGASTEESEDNCAAMAVKQLMDYLENGNIKNSVNYPNCDMGVCTHACRLAVHHRNVANMITQFTKVFGEAGVNIHDMTNKGRGDYAYTLMDLDAPITGEMLAAMRSIDGVLKVRVVK